MHGCSTQYFRQTIGSGDIVISEQFPMAEGKRTEVEQITEMCAKTRQQSRYRNCECRSAGVASAQAKYIVLEWKGFQTAEFKGSGLIRLAIFRWRQAECRQGFAEVSGGQCSDSAAGVHRYRKQGQTRNAAQPGGTKPALSVE